MSLEPPQLVLAFSILFIAYTVRGIAGFGSGLIAIPLLALLLPLKLVVPIVVLLDFMGSAAQGVSNRQHIKWSALVPLLPFTAIGIALALYFFNSVDASLLKLALGIFVILFAIYQLLPAPDLQGGAVMAFPFGLLGGLLGTLFGTGGPFYVMYFNMRNLPKNEFRASFATYFLIDGSVRIAVYIFGLSLLNTDFLYALLLAIPPFALGLYCGGRVHREIPTSLFKKLISFILFASGSALVMQY